MAVALGVALIVPVRSQDASRDLPARIRAWVDAYERQLPSIVAEERYEQKVSRLRRGGRDRYTPPPSSAREVVQQRVLESEFLLVKPANGFEWIPFRDVSRVDGQVIHDRADRLARLLLDPTASSYDAAARIGEESTRYNIGGLVRTVNVPTLALAFLTTRNAKCCKVKVHDLDTIEGERFQRMSFDETVVPGIVGTKEGRRVKTKGEVWVRPDGALRRSRLVMTVGGTLAEIQVDWKVYAGLDMVVPVEMQEYYSYGAREIEGLAVYTNIRKFGVTTHETVKKPGTSAQVTSPAPHDPRGITNPGEGSLCRDGSTRTRAEPAPNPEARACSSASRSRC